MCVSEFVFGRCCVRVCLSDLAATAVAAVDLSSLSRADRSGLSVQFKSTDTFDKAERTLSCTGSD